MNKKNPRVALKAAWGFNFLDVSENLILALVNDGFDIPDRQSEFFCQRLKTDAVNQSTLYNFSVAFGVVSDNPLINKMD